MTDALLTLSSFATFLSTSAAQFAQSRPSSRSVFFHHSFPPFRSVSSLCFRFRRDFRGRPAIPGAPHSFRAYLWLSHRSTVTPIIVECLFNCQDLFAKFFRFLSKYFSCLLNVLFRVKILGAAPSSKNRASPRAANLCTRGGSVFIDKCNLISLFYYAWKYRLRYFRNARQKHLAERLPRMAGMCAKKSQVPFCTLLSCYATKRLAEYTLSYGRYRCIELCISLRAFVLICF